jgi:hypothetical protein
MMKRAIFLLCISATAAFGQAVRLTDNPDQFLPDLQKLMATGNAASIRAEKNLETVWADTRLSADQKQRVMMLCRQMNQKKYLPVPHFTPLFEGLYNAVYTQNPDQQPADVGEFITVAEKQFAAGDAKTFAKVLETIRLFLERRLFYASNFNKLYALGGTFSLRFVETGTSVNANSNTGSAPASVTTNSSRFDGWDDPIPVAATDSGALRPVAGRTFIPDRKQIPAVSGAVITVKNGFIAIVTAGDSVVLAQTSGDLLLKDGVFVGKGGKFTWENAGRADIFVTLADYALTTMNPRLTADDVTLTYPSLKPVVGVFEYVSKKPAPGKKATYPRFMSWQNDVALPELGKDIEYRGGLALEGVRLVGASASKNPAILIVKDRGKPALKIVARKIEFADSLGLITAQYAAFTGYLGSMNSKQLSAISKQVPANSKQPNSQTANSPSSDGWGEATKAPAPAKGKSGKGKSGKTGKSATTPVAEKPATTTATINNLPLATYNLQLSDSITHPSVNVTFDKNQRVMWLNRADRTTYGRVPFSDSYHKLYVLPEVLRWDVKRQKVDFYQVGAKRDVPVRFESFDYFLPQRYADLTVDYGFHPLQMAASYVSKTKNQTFLPDELARFSGVNVNILEGSLNRMVLEGYIDRDDAGLMHLSRKGILYVLAYNNLTDYDNFQIQSTFVSSDSVKNASINLVDNLLTIRGVTRFTVSDSLKLFGIPADKTLRVGKGRSFTLNGQFKAGTFRYSGQNLAFDYDKFGMNLNKIDSITFVPQKVANRGGAQEVGGDIKYENPGMVYFATADNKSGRMKDKKTTQRLVMPEGMTVYFNQSVRGNITYNEKVYFKIPAIDNDSLGKGDISFMGTFHSGGIFPDFKAELKTMPDNTLGFVHKAPPTGYPVYGTASTVKFLGDVTMDKSGLRSVGTLNHLTTSLNTTGILFMTDSLLASGDKGEIKEGVLGKPAAYFPQVQVNNFSLNWYPKRDSLVLMTQKNNFTLYNASTTLEGNLLVRSAGLFGNGILRRKDSEATSEKIKFNKEGFLADNANFKILPGEAQKGIANKPILLGNDVNVDFNQVKNVVNLAMPVKKGQGIDDTLNPVMEFPFAAYKTNIGRAQWSIAAKTIAMRGDVKTSTFTATGEEQESLTFNGAAALYDVEKMALNISGVPFINAADARIYPDKGVVSIKRNGEMVALKNARLELDTVSRFHRLKNGNIQVISRTRFSGDATYQFATAMGDTASIKMGKFDLREAAKFAVSVPTKRKDPIPPTPEITMNGVEKTQSASSKKQAGKAKSSPVVAKTQPVKRQPSRAQPQNLPPNQTYFTTATAEVTEKDNLQLAPRMQFKGAITMNAPEEDLSLEGSIKPILKKRKDLVGGWIPFKEKVVETITIKVDKTLKNEDDQPLVAGIHHRAGGTGLYPTFLSPKEDPRDEDIFSAMGLMRYDEKTKLFRITGKDAAGLDDEENAFTFNDPKGTMAYQGKLNLMNTAPNEYLLAAGSAKINVDSALYRINALMVFALPVPEPLNTAIAQKLVEANLDEKADPADDDLNALVARINPIIGLRESEAYRAKSQNNHVSLALASPKLLGAVVLSNVNLRWSEKTNAFYSVGKLGVATMFTTDVNAEMDGMVEIRKTANGDEASIYLEASPDVWAFYEYRPGNGPGTLGQMVVITSEQELNDKALAMGNNPDKKAPKPTADLIAGTPDEKDAFVNVFENQYRTRQKPKPKPVPAAAKPTPGSKTPVAKSQTDEPAADEPAVPTPEKTATSGTGEKKAAGKDATGKPAVSKDAKDPAPKVVKQATPKEKKKDKEDQKEGF